MTTEEFHGPGSPTGSEPALPDQFHGSDARDCWQG